MQTPPPPTGRYAATSPRRGRDKVSYSPKLKSLSRHLRKNMTDAEGLLWYCLRDFRVHGFHFRRQVPIGKYITDFACLKYKLIVEVDGSHHGDPEQERLDQRRGQWLADTGYTVLRYDNNEIFTDCDMVLSNIQHALDSSLPLTGGGGRAAVGGGSPEIKL